MGVLSSRIKPSFLGLLKFLNSFHWIIIFFSLINLSVCIYEDQIGKFDWRQSYVGRIKFSQFDTVSTAKKIIVATEENVLAALHLKTGQVVWRHVFESSATGNIQLLHVSDKVVTVSGVNPYIVRGWDPNTGVLLWEWSLVLQNDASADFSEWFVQNNMLVHVLPMIGSHLEVTMYNVMTGQNRGATSRLPAAWNNEGCILTPPYYSCISSSEILMSLDVTSNAVQILSKPLSTFDDSQQISIRPLDGATAIPGFIINDKKVIMINKNEFELVKIPLADQSASVTITDSFSGPLLVQSWNDDNKGFFVTTHNIATGAEVPELKFSNKELSIPDAELSAVMCTRTSKESHVCRLLVTGADEASHLLQQGGRVIWTREEALANVVAAEFVDLPVSDLDAAIESEFDQKEGSIWNAFSRRLQTQYQQLMTLINNLQSSETSSTDKSSPLVRDYFNLHKIIVLVTDAGKIFGMDNLSGELLWKRYEPSLATDNVLIFTRRSARHPPHDAYITILGKHEVTGNGLIISLNPIRGTLVGERVLHLDTQILQCALLDKPDPEKLHALILLDKEKSVMVLPVSAAPLVENVFIYLADKNTASVWGYALKYDGTSVTAQRTWSLNLGGARNSGHKIVVSAGKLATENAHSAGVVLGDRSVLYKHINPNAVLFITQGPDPAHKDIVVATLVDVVSGNVITSQVHRRARALPLAVHSENFLAYFYYNDKQRRTEIATLELYEGLTRWLPAGAEFSSFHAGAPHSERGSYIASVVPRAAALTHTQRHLTHKHVLVALSTGAIVELAWAFLTPRRPVAPTAEEREEGLIPYAPELPFPAEAVINYNTTLHRIRDIYTNPAGLESTCLVLATGLDLFYTRVAPSKTFDLLKDDFDYYLITIVLAALIVATYSTKYFASRKITKMAWK